MKNILTYGLFILLAFAGTDSFSQTSNFNSDGDWGDAGLWDNGVPTSTTDATIEGFNCTVAAQAECNNLTLWDGTVLTINDDIKLSIDGNLNMEPNTSIVNSGKFAIKGNLQKDGNTKVTIGGALEFQGSIELDETIIELN